MKLLACCLSVVLTVFFVSCQKEYSVEQSDPSRGSLRSDVTFDCLPKTVNGTFKSGAALGDTNYIEVEVMVTQPGSYAIGTDTVNGYFFRGTGTFASSGVSRVKLAGSGTPLTAGINSFMVVYDTTFCFIPVTVLPGTVSGPAAAFTLAGAGSACTAPQFAGNYVRGTALTASNTVTLGVTVTTPGTYTVTTNSVNGMQFSGTGTLTGTGARTIVLTGTGTPTADGTFNFTVTAGATTCTFPVTVTATTPPVSAGNHFPLTANSWWSYNDPYATDPTDTLKRENNDEETVNSVLYRVFEETYESDPTGSIPYYFRKEGNNYYEYTYADWYSLPFSFDNNVEGDILFLKEGLSTGDTWNSAEFTGTVGGVSTKLRYVYTCTAANATATLNGHTFNNVYKITFRPQTATGTGSFTDVGTVWEVWYANNVGMVYVKTTLGAASEESTIRHYRVF
jgi:hypothetical protein